VSIHYLFDLLALLAAVATRMAFRPVFPVQAGPVPETLRPAYFTWLVVALVVGSLLAGSLNLHLGGMEHGFGKSVLGGLVAAVMVAELFKWRHGIKGSTGVAWVPSLAIGLVVGRWGCFLAGLPDYTYGIPTDLPWGYDFGDGVSRHPVQLYESFSMAIFFVLFTLGARRRCPFLMQNGFYLFAFYYGMQRFLWEFLKPYPTVVEPFNLFHLLCLLLIAYALLMIVRTSRDHP